MKTSLAWLAAVAALLCSTGCSTTDSRIGSHQAAFESWPADVREKVRAGQVAVGFTEEMVQVALGEPDRRATRTTAQGTAEVWIYPDRRTHFSIGLGVGAAHGSSAYGGGVVVGDNGFRDDEAMRVIFEHGRVTAIEVRR